MGSSGANGLNSIPEFSPTKMDIKFPVIYFVTLTAASGNPWLPALYDSPESFNQGRFTLNIIHYQLPSSSIIAIIFDCIIILLKRE